MMGDDNNPQNWGVPQTNLNPNGLPAANQGSDDSAMKVDDDPTSNHIPYFELDEKQNKSGFEFDLETEQHAAPTPPEQTEAKDDTVVHNDESIPVAAEKLEQPEQAEQKSEDVAEKKADEGYVQVTSEGFFKKEDSEQEPEKPADALAEVDSEGIEIPEEKEEKKDKVEPEAASHVVHSQSFSHLVAKIDEQRKTIQKSIDDLSEKLKKLDGVHDRIKQLQDEEKNIQQEIESIV